MSRGTTLKKLLKSEGKIVFFRGVPCRLAYDGQRYVFKCLYSRRFCRCPPEEIMYIGELERLHYFTSRLNYPWIRNTVSV